ncbi:MAG: alginate O-acetyltransferase AlgX-related protein [Janthinobacterium lividum]
MKHVLLFLLLLLFIAPALQAKFHWLAEPALGGAYITAEHPELTAESLTAGEYQAKLERYLEDRLGFRPWLVRLRNQLSFSLLGVARSSELVIGRDNVLFQPGPVNSYLGKDFLGEAEIRHRVHRMRSVQQALAQRGIPFLFMMAPNKARYQPEDLPAYLSQQKQPHSNYEVFIREMRANNINVLDFCQLFERWKDTTRYPLFPKGGTHWSGYASTLAADTLFRRMEQLGSFNLLNFRREGPVQVSRDTMRSTDGDLSNPLNLLRPYQHYPMAYPRIVFSALQPGEQRPNLLVSGDSFGAALMQFNPYMQTIFSPDSRYWGVEETIFLFSDNSARTGENLNQLDFRQQIESRQFIMLLVTEHNLLYDGFINRLYDLYHPLTDADRAHIEKLKETLARNATWEEGSDPHFADNMYQKAYTLFNKERE